MSSQTAQASAPARHRTARPGLRPGLVERPRLTQGLVHHEQVPVAPIAAGAGYGKTTLLAQGEAGDRRPFAWVSMEADETDVAEVFQAT